MINSTRLYSVDQPGSLHTLEEICKQGRSVYQLRWSGIDYDSAYRRCDAQAMPMGYRIHCGSGFLGHQAGFYGVMWSGGWSCDRLGVRGTHPLRGVIAERLTAIRVFR